MASQSQGSLLKDTPDAYSQIIQKLSKNGIAPESSEVEKLLSLWKIYQHQESDLKKAKEAEQKMKEAQAEEMKEVENYVEHIKHLSDERESLIHELEAENETLKAQVANQGQGNNEEAQAEITEMLTQQGLAEVSDASQSEQIAYLLVERARLLEELEDHNNSGGGDAKTGPNNEGVASETELKQFTEQEKRELEEELAQQQERAKVMREQLKQEHEEEVNALMEENSKLEEDLQKAEMMVSQLKAELSKFTDGEESDAGLNQSLKSLGSEEERKKMNEERNQLNREREMLEKEMGEVEEERTEFRKEKDKFNQEKAALEKERVSLFKELSQMKQMKTEMEGERQELAYEREYLEREKKLLEKKEQDLEAKGRDFEQRQEEVVKENEEWEKENKEGPGGQNSQSGSLSPSSSDMALRKIIEEKTKIEGEIIQLRSQMRTKQKEKETHNEEVLKLKGDLEKSHLQHQQLQVKNRALKAELEELETQLDEAEANTESLTKEKLSLTEKFTLLNSEVTTLRSESTKSSTLQDIVEILNNDKRQLTESLESLKGKLEQMENEKKQLANQNQFLSKEEQDLTNELSSCKQELEGIARQKVELSRENHELISLTKKQEEIEKLLRSELEELKKVKEKFVNQTETLSKENKDLLNKLDRTRQELESTKFQLQESTQLQIVLDHLKEQNLQLQNQASFSQDELAKSKERETMLISTQQSFQKSHDDSGKRYTQEIDDLKVKLELTLQELSKSKKMCQDLKKNNSGLEETLKRTKAQLQESVKVKEQLEAEQSHKQTLKLEVSRLEFELAEKTLLAEKFESERRLRVELESQVSHLQEMEKSLKVLHQELENEQQKRKRLERNVEAQEAANREKQLRGQLEARIQELEQQLKSRIQQLEQQLQEAERSIESATGELKNEKELREGLENNVKELQMTLIQQESAVKVTKPKEVLNQENVTVRNVQESKEDLQMLYEQLEKERLLRAELARKITDLEALNGEVTSTTLQTTLEQLKKEQKARAKSVLRLQEMEQILEDQKLDGETLQQSMSGKIMALENRVQVLQEDLFNAQDELQTYQDRYHQAMTETEAAKQELETIQATLKITPTPVLTKTSTLTLGTQHEDELDSGVVATSSRLQAILNELNTLKSILSQAQEELQLSHLNISSSRQEVEILKQSLVVATEHLDQYDEELRSLKHKLAETQSALQEAQSQLHEKQAKLNLTVEDMDKVKKELITMRDDWQARMTSRPMNPAFYGEEERQKHVEKILTLEKLSRQLEFDNRETSRKLSDATFKCDNLEEQLRKEKLRSSDKYHQNSRYIDQLEKDIDAANKQQRQLREELQQHQSKIFRLEADNLGFSAKFERAAARLEKENTDLKQRLRQELDNIRQKMEAQSSEAAGLREQKRELEKEVGELKLQVARLKSENERLEYHLQAEGRGKLELENRNSVIDLEMSKVLNQIRSLMEKNAQLEAANHSLEQELNSKCSTIRQVETTLSQKEATYEVSTKVLTVRAEASENKDFGNTNVRDLQTELENITHKMLTLEFQLTQTDSEKNQLENTRNKLVTIKNHLAGEKLQRTLLDQTVSELKHQVVILKQRESNVSIENKGLQHVILDLESQLSHLQDSPISNYESPKSELGQQSLMDQVAKLQREVRELQCELYGISERRDLDMKRYEERKLRTKAKLLKAREFYTLERSKYQEGFKTMEEDLQLTQAKLAKEFEWREKMDDSYKLLLGEKRDLITQLSETEEALRDKTHALSMAQALSEHLEEENSHLQDRLQTISQQKHHLDKLLIKQGENCVVSPVGITVGTSGLGSLDSAWDPPDKMDSLNQLWSLYVDPPANFRKASVVDAGVPVSISRHEGEDRIRVNHDINRTHHSQSHAVTAGVVPLPPKAFSDASFCPETDDKDNIESYLDESEFEA